MRRRAVSERPVRRDMEVVLFNRYFRPGLLCAALLAVAGAHAQRRLMTADSRRATS